jgi:hypothetical protein
MESGLAGISYQRTSGHITKTQQWLELYTEQILERWDKFSDGGPRVYELLSHRIQQLHERLSNTAIYEYGLKQILNTPETDGTWHKTLIMHDPFIDASFIKLGNDSSIPIHDHPDTIGMILVLEGMLELRSFTINPEIISFGRQAAYLRPADFQRLHKGGTSMVLPEKGNLHNLRCHDGHCILLDVQVSLPRRQEPRWFFPVGPAPDVPGNILAAEIPNSVIHSTGATLNPIQT